MVECNIKNCEELAPVRMSDCIGNQYLYLCRVHSTEYGNGIVQLGDMDIDFYQKWENM